MANENKNINELVDDDASTAELELITATHESRAQKIRETDDDTSNFGASDSEQQESIERLSADLRIRSETISRLEFSIEQLRTKSQGLETELGARAEMTARLNDELANVRESLRRKEKLIKQRDDTIRQLKAEIRERYEELQTAVAEHEAALAALESDKASLGEVLEIENTGEYQQRLAEQAGRLVSQAAALREIKEKNDRAERYGDQLRRQLQEKSELADSAVRDRDKLIHKLERRTEKVQKLSAELDALQEHSASLEQKLAGVDERHAEEIRIIRFELGEAQETVAQHELMNEQLASDLVQTRGFKVELENMLDKTDRESRSQIDKLENENRQLRQENEEQSKQLASKSETLNCLLQELARKTQQAESMGEIEHVIDDIDQRVAEHADDRTALDKDRVTRVLIGSVEGQELRFPLFKARLTIGRTEQNDIQLRAAYISRRHAVIVTEGDSTRVIDWGSKNGVFVNGARVTEHFLASGDIVAIGTAKFRYEERPKRDPA